MDPTHNPNDCDLVNTRVLILSDTHGCTFSTPSSLPNKKMLSSVDVVIYCGDITDEQKMEEFRHSDTMTAPLQLVVLGNLDFSMDPEAFERKATEAQRVHSALTKEDLEREYGSRSELQSLFRKYEEKGIFLLAEGQHEFDLVNGAHRIEYM